MYPSVDKKVVNTLTVQDDQNVNYVPACKGPTVLNVNKRDAHVRSFAFLTTIITLVKMYTPLCGSECEFSNGVVHGNVEPVSCVALQRLKTVLCSVFGHTQFRPGQLEVMLPALHGKDGIVKMATGAGKSLCMFMVPLAYSDTAVGIIISPLNALMDDQVTLKY